MAQSKNGAALQHQRAPSKCLSRVVDEVEFGLVVQRRRCRPGSGGRHRPAVLVLATRTDGAESLCDGRLERGRRGREKSNVLDGFGDLGNVLLDEVLGACERAVVQLGRADVAEIPNEPRAEEIDELVDVGFVAHLHEGVEAFVNEAVVVVLRGRIISPARQSVISKRAKFLGIEP